MSHRNGDKTFKNNLSTKSYPWGSLWEKKRSPGQDVNVIDERKDKVRARQHIRKLFIGQICYEPVNAQKDELWILAESASQTTKTNRATVGWCLKKPCKQMNLFPLSAAVWYKSNVKNNKQPSWSGLQFKSFGDLSEEELQPHVWEQRGTANMFTHKILVFLSRKWLKRISAPHWYEGKYPNSFFHNLLTCFPVDGDINPVSFYKNLNMRSGIQQPDPS